MSAYEVLLLTKIHMMRRAVRRTVLLLSACGAAATVDKTAGLRWQAADELARLHPRATDATPHARLRRELERSIHSCVRSRPASNGNLRV